MKLTKFFAIVLFSALLVTGCSYTEEEKAQMEEYKKTAEKNAIEYIEEKYDFTPSVISLECAKVNSVAVLDFSPSPTGNVYVEMEDKKRDIHFWVYATGEEKSTESCWDNYQHKEMEEEFERRVEFILGEEAEHIDLAYGKFATTSKYTSDESTPEKTYGLVHEYFDGENLTEILENAVKNKMVVCLAEKEKLPDLLGISKTTLEDDGRLVENFGENLDCLFINFRDTKAYTAAHTEGCVSNITGHPSNYGFDDYLIYIRDYYYVTSKMDGIHAEYERYDLKQYDDFYYILADGTYCDFSKANNEMDPASAWKGHGFLNPKKVFDAYRVDTDANKIYLFIPVDKIDVEQVTEEMDYKSEIEIVKQCYDEKSENGNLRHSTMVTDLINNHYLTTTMYFYDFDKENIFSVLVEQD